MREPGLSLIVVPEDGGASRAYRLTRRRVRQVKMAGGAALVLLVVLASTWPILAVRASRTGGLQDRVLELEGDRVRIAELVRALEELETRYDHLRSMFGPSPGQPAPGLWLPPPTSGRAPSTSTADAAPGAWPLADRGFVTQSLLEDDSGQHPGVDIAVPADTYVRATGAGTVAEVGEDPVYGRYVALDHGQGFSSLYAHASQTFVTQGQVVRRGEVIALSGNTGRSTAPHLHFEILLEGVPVDPLTLVRPPA
jgi:murein DD-endopeptidase MepM/ murein hydrolase activator NlpD